MRLKKAMLPLSLALCVVLGFVSGYTFASFQPENTYVVRGAVETRTSVFNPENTGKIDINSAGLTELCDLPGIGPVTAQKIIDYREANGYFETLDELLEIPGIGEKTLEKLIPYAYAGFAA